MPYVEYDEVAAVCPECGRPFRADEELRAHVAQTHADPGPARPPAPGGTAAIRCTVCGRGFRSASALQRHIASAHTT